MVLHKPGTTTKYDNGLGGAKSPHRAVSLFYFRKTKQNLSLFPQNYGHHFPTYMKIKKQGTLLHTYDTDCTFSHRTCTSFIQIHLGILTALIFRIAPVSAAYINVAVRCEWSRYEDMRDSLNCLCFLCNIILEKYECSLCGCSLSVCQSVCLSVSLSVSHSVCQSVCLSECFCQSFSQLFCQSVCLSVTLSVCLSVSLSVS